MVFSNNYWHSYTDYIERNTYTYTYSITTNKMLIANRSESNEN